MISVYTDGAYSSDRNIGGWAFYIPEWNIRVGGKAANTTNNRMELMAVLQALKFLSELNTLEPIVIYSDSMYVIGGLNLSWSKAKNSDLWSDISFILDLMINNITFKHVKGHDSCKENCIVDSIAVKMTKLYE
jgi:ribonuclease HI